MKHLPAAVALLALAAPAPAAVYQHAVPVTAPNGKEVTAFLWVPPDADRIRGVVVGGSILMEPAFAADPAIRKVCAAEQLAIVLFHPHLDAVFDYAEKKSDALLQKALDALAQASGYRELSAAPLFPFGHSVASIFASHVVCRWPDRCFGALLFKGGIRTPANDPAASLAGVPVLVVKGQFEEFGPGPGGALRENEDRETAWKTMRDNILALRAKDARHLVSYLVEPGAGHFAWSESVSAHAATFLAAAAKARIPDWPIDAKQPVTCTKVDPASGALTDADMKGAAAVAPAKAFWHPTAELAKSADAVHAGLFDRKPQFVTFADPAGKPIFVGHDLRLRLNPTWTGPDTFKVGGTFLEKSPDKYPKAEKAGHAAGPVRFRVFGGAAEQLGPDEFRVGMSGQEKVRAEILAWHPGDKEYRWAEQQGRVNVPEVLKDGKVQAITFDAPGDLKVGGPGLKLQATSDAGLKVRFYVESGPAVIDGDTLVVRELPKRATFPVAVRVVAYQYGSAVEPRVQSAAPVVRTVGVTK
ncbi:MAG: hypothetical protein C0501_05490 [Isosphaera sp.]|nr:hypothetical protein [Isosphaera sp.]